ERAKELEEKHTAEQVAAAVAAGGVSGGAEGLETSEGAAMKAESEEARKERVADEAYMGYIADYLTQRICMPDETGAQRDHSQPGVDDDSAVPGDSGENKMNANIENQGGDGNEQ
ncbi:unnamed protein product, partial [Sphacelaria rigidula]